MKWKHITCLINLKFLFSVICLFIWNGDIFNILKRTETLARNVILHGSKRVQIRRSNVWWRVEHPIRAALEFLWHILVVFLSIFVLAASVVIGNGSHYFFTWLLQLIIDHNFWFHQMPSNNSTRLCCWCWWLTRLALGFSALEIVFMYSFFIASDDTMQK